MDSQNTATNSNSKPWRQLLRWFMGGIIGYVFGLSLFIPSESGQPPLIGLVIFGQGQLFEDLMFYLLEEHFKSTDPILLASVITYSTVWAVIGALLFSSQKKQLKTNTIADYEVGTGSKTG